MVQDDRTLEAHTSQIAQSDQLVPGWSWPREALSAYLLWRDATGLAAVHLFCLMLYGVRCSPESPHANQSAQFFVGLKREQTLFS